MYEGASPCSALYVSRQLELDALLDGNLEANEGGPAARA